MSDIIKSTKNNLVSLIHEKNDKLSIPKPFEWEIFLFDTYVAGAIFVKEIDEIFYHLALEEKLDFFREPNNPHDRQAIVIKTSNNVKIGYVPKVDNLIYARLMDAG